MENHALADQFTSVFFCFRFDRDAIDHAHLHVPFTKKNGKQVEMWKPEKLQPYHLKERVAGMFAGEGAVGRIYALEDGVRRDMDIPEVRVQAALCCRSRETEIPVRLQSVRLTLFYTGIGILEFLFTGSGGCDEALDMNYYLSEVKSGANRLRFSQRMGKDETVEKSVRLIDLLEMLLTPLGRTEDFDSRSGMKYIDSKPLVFTYLLFRRFPSDLGRVLFGLRTNFKSSYKVPERELSLDEGFGVYHPFENQYWGFSLNGAACCACLTDDPSTNTFFRETFPYNLRSTYKLLFLLRVHQRFMIQDLEDRFSAAGASLVGAKDSEIDQVYRSAGELRGEAALFRMQCFFQEPASVEHINRFDAALSGSMSIETSYEGLQSSLLLLEQLSETARERIRAREAAMEQVRDLKRERLIFLATALWSMVLLFQSACEIMDRLLGRDLLVTDPLTAVPLVIAVAPAIKMLYDFRRRGKQIRELEKFLES